MGDPEENPKSEETTTQPPNEAEAASTREESAPLPNPPEVLPGHVPGSGEQPSAA